MKNGLYTLAVEPADDQQKLSQILSKHITGLSHSRAKLAIESGLLTVNKRRVKDILALGYTNDFLKIDLRQGCDPKSRTEYLLRGIEIVYEDSDIIVVSKPAGILVHQTPDKERGVLIELIHRYFRKKKQPAGYLKTVHRIDKETSGLVIFPRNAKAHTHMGLQFKNHTITRSYVCIVHGHLKPEKGTFTTNLVREIKHTGRRGSSYDENRGKEAITHYEVKEYLDEYTVVECRLETGLTHQIRIHLSEAGHPLLGEEVYIPKELRKTQRFPRQALHAGTIQLTHPGTNRAVGYTAKMPKDMAQFIEKHRPR